LLFIACSVADPDPGSGTLMTPGSGTGKKSTPDPGSGMNIPDDISESLETKLLRLKILVVFGADPESF
jgi:hypothetical protein